MFHKFQAAQKDTPNRREAIRREKNMVIAT